jgi:DMSO reductase anchor subunit
MHPAPSLVVFTVISGAGFGLLALLGLAAALGLVTADRGPAALGLGLALASLGLAASTFHLGHPERAWRAFSQWRSSWLSREAVLALATYPPAMLLGALWLFSGDGPSRPLGLLTALVAAATLVCTAMIYASLRPVARWHTPWVPACFLGLGLATGSAWLWLALAMGDAGSGAAALAAILAILGWALKLLYWRATDGRHAPADTGSATGLAGLGRLRLVEPPHVGENYLLREMGFRVARRHAARLRRIAVGLGGGATTALALAALVSAAPQLPLAALAVASSMLGTLVERWLFFAEARHTVMLYYGAESA